MYLRLPLEDLKPREMNFSCPSTFILKVRLWEVSRCLRLGLRESRPYQGSLNGRLIDKKSKEGRGMVGVNRAV